MDGEDLLLSNMALNFTSSTTVQFGKFEGSISDEVTNSSINWDYRSSPISGRSN